jgi:hypothetical protein
MNKIQPGILKDLLSEAGLEKVKENSKSYIFDCPRCHKKDKLYLRKTDGRFVCWICKETDNFQGAPEFLFTELLGTPVGELRRKIWGIDGPVATVHIQIELKDFFGDEDEIEVIDSPMLPVEPNPEFRALTSQWSVRGVEYLASRGVPIEVALRYGIQYWPMAKRIVFPVKSNGLLLGWQSRYIEATEGIDEDDNPFKVLKALTYDGLKKDKVLMFADRITDKHAILCEGPMDAIKCDLVGGNVCSMGKAVSKRQLELLKNSGISKLYLGLDPDASREVERIVKEMSSFMEIYDMRPPTHTDLGAMSFEEVKELFYKAPKVTSANIFVYLKDFYTK